MASARSSSHLIAVVTGTRAEFGLLRSVMRAIAAQPGLALRTLVTGLHLVQDTWREVRDSGFAIDAKVRMQRPGAVGRAADVAALGRGITGIGRVLAQWQPTLTLVLGDRIEALAAGSAAAVGGWRLGHIHGGDRAEGVADEAMRHALSKLAHLHFAACASSARRLVRMGEDPARVLNVGSPALDELKLHPPATDEQLQALGLPTTQPFVVVLQHPTGAADRIEQQRMHATLRATRRWPRLVLAPNYDPGRAGVLAALREARAAVVEHLPRALFVGVLKRAAVLVGNSSAGMIEASAVRPGGLPVVNLGSRQAGRERGRNVLDCEESETAIRAAVTRALTDPPRARRQPFGDGTAGVRIAQLLGAMDWTKLPVQKRNCY